MHLRCSCSLLTNTLSFLLLMGRSNRSPCIELKMEKSRNVWSVSLSLLDWSDPSKRLTGSIVMDIGHILYGLKPYNVRSSLLVHAHLRHAFQPSNGASFNRILPRWVRFKKWVTYNERAIDLGHFLTGLFLCSIPMEHWWNALGSNEILVHCRNLNFRTHAVQTHHVRWQTIEDLSAHLPTYALTVCKQHVHWHCLLQSQTIKESEPRVKMAS